MLLKVRKCEIWYVWCMIDTKAHNTLKIKRLDNIILIQCDQCFPSLSLVHDKTDIWWLRIWESETSVSAINNRLTITVATYCSFNASLTCAAGIGKLATRSCTRVWTISTFCSCCGAVMTQFLSIQRSASSKSLISSQRSPMAAGEDLVSLMNSEDLMRVLDELFYKQKHKDYVQLFVEGVGENPKWT